MIQDFLEAWWYEDASIVGNSSAEARKDFGALRQEEVAVTRMVQAVWDVGARV